MPDFGAILRKARQVANNGGNAGNSGNGLENGKSNNTLTVPVSVPTAKMDLGTVGTDQSDVPTVPMGNERMGTRASYVFHDIYQILSQTVPTVPTGPTEKHDFCRNTDVEAFRRAALRNSPALFEPQADPNRCHICGERETADAPFIAVLTAKPGTHHWLHADCHPEHVRRLDARVEAALADDEPAPF